MSTPPTVARRWCTGTGILVSMVRLRHEPWTMDSRSLVRPLCRLGAAVAEGVGEQRIDANVSERRAHGFGLLGNAGKPVTGHGVRKRGQRDAVSGASGHVLELAQHEAIAADRDETRRRSGDGEGVGAAVMAAGVAGVDEAV